MKHQALFSLKDKSKILKFRMLQFLFGALRVKVASEFEVLNALCISICIIAEFQIKRGNRDNLGIIFLIVTYRIYPKYSDTLNVRTPSFFLKRHLFYVPYISGHVPYRVFLLSVNVRTPKTCPLFLIKLLFFTT